MPRTTPQVRSSPGPLHKHVLGEHVRSLFLPGLYHLEFGRNHTVRAGTGSVKQPKGRAPTACTPEFPPPHKPVAGRPTAGLLRENSDQQRPPEQPETPGWSVQALPSDM